MSTADYIVVGAFFTFGAAMCYFVGRAHEWESNRKEAVKLGHAEYVIVDPATGKTEFRWKERAS